MRTLIRIGLFFSLGLALVGSAAPSVREEQLFLAQPKYIGSPQAGHVIANRDFQGIPSLAVTPAGRLWATWYAGKTPGEDENNYIVLSTSGDNGATWREVLIVDPDSAGPVRAFDPEVWMAPDGNLRLTWSQAIRGCPDEPNYGHDGSIAGVWVLEIFNVDSETPAWEAPVRVANGIVMCKPLVLSTGEWVLPVSTWITTDNSAKMVVSADQGITWSIRGACNVPVDIQEFDEHMFIERKDGTIWLLARATCGIGESVSADRGATWPELKPSSIPHTPARFFITRLNSGNLLLVKHGPMNKKIGRSHLTAFISTDDGKTWGGGLILDERNGISYPDGQQSADGLIRIIYDYNRRTDRHILMATFRENDAAAGRVVSDAVKLRQVVSDASGGIAPESK